MKYFVYRDGQECGPYASVQIRERLDSGSLLLSDPARAEGTSEMSTVEALLVRIGVLTPKLEITAPKSNRSDRDGSWKIEVIPRSAARQAVEPVPAAVRIVDSLPIAVRQSAGIDVQPKSKGNAITWPFKENRWYLSLWMPMAWWFLPPFGLFLCLGWSVDAVGRMGRDEEESLPGIGDIGSILKRGFIVLVMACLYFFIPLFIIAKIVEWNWLLQASDFFVWLWNIIRHKPHESFFPFLARQIVKAAATATAPAIYVAIAAPLFLAARIRYSLYGKSSAFFNVFASAWLVMQNLEGVLLCLFWSVLAEVALGFVGLVLAATGIGLPGTVIVGAAGIWILAYSAGSLGAQVYEKDQKKRKRAEAA